MRRSPTPRPSSITPQVKAPISGVAGLRQVDIGNIVNASTQTGIVTIAQIEPIAVIFTAPEEQLPYINEAPGGRAARRSSRSPPTARSRWPTGTLAVINNQVDTTSGTIRLKAVFDNKDHALWPGQSVSTRLLVKTLKDATVVPDDAIQHGTDGLYAYVGQSGQQGRTAQGQGQPVDRRTLGGR